MQNLTRSIAPGNTIAIAITRDGQLQLRLQPVFGIEDGLVTAVECRLWRRVRSEGLASDGFGTTAAGFRVPLAVIPEFAERLLAMAKTGPTKGAE
jgi:hypothetical protein